MTDASLIEHLGGSSKVAELLGLPKAGGVQRVNNWKTRGIPPKMKLARPDLFMNSAPPVPPAPEETRDAV